ncbi:hypothetical protein HJC23_004525 [Cyclotella cryptica]|uniref:Aminoglycoside phosphotransferase domain-containing protein n=1 Tax=Cyclotella cryptica TaxID=29204 RepID=A0ABD3P308_9STRA|eukprot:CCRYP_018064-RA/>CCRYP_018064-RA protein AED:0.02 eAED:0.02 QI:61/1/1/1/0/0/2/582/395
MTSAKLLISSSSHTNEQLSTILSDYANSPIRSSKQLFGGYSGGSYLIELDTAPDGTASRYVLKVSNGYTYDNAEFMCRTASYLQSVGYRDCCLPIPKMTTEKQSPHTKDPYVYVSQREPSGIPAFLLNYVQGEQADKIMRDRPELAPNVMRGIGGGLGRMHASSAGIDRATANALGLRWYETDGGCCDVEDHVRDTILNKIMSDSDAREHEFLSFYQRELTSLKREMQLGKDCQLAIGITHGDPFADNILSNPESGELSAFIDIEDVCVGPLLFDLACCAIGCCFTGKYDRDIHGHGGKYKQVIDFSLLSALLDGYCTERKLPTVEVEHLVAYMRLALLCNCCWRFVKFNITMKEKDIPQAAKSSYLELQQRIEYLQDYKVEAGIQRLLKDLQKV